MVGSKGELPQVLGDLHIEKDWSKNTSVGFVREGCAHMIRLMDWTEQGAYGSGGHVGVPVVRGSGATCPIIGPERALCPVVCGISGRCKRDFH